MNVISNKKLVKLLYKITQESIEVASAGVYDVPRRKLLRVAIGGAIKTFTKKYIARAYTKRVTSPRTSATPPPFLHHAAEGWSSFMHCCYVFVIFPDDRIFARTRNRKGEYILTELV